MLHMTRRVLAAFAAAAVLLARFAACRCSPRRTRRCRRPCRTTSSRARPRTSTPVHPLHEIGDALVRLPLAAALGAALALRPKRRGTPPRTPAVVQTQIVLSLVGAIVMLVVGTSLARAFGIVGAANLVRYRSKIDDPKDAAVMLCALSVGLASGVGLYAMAIFSTAFMLSLPCG